MMASRRGLRWVLCHCCSPCLLNCFQIDGGGSMMRAEVGLVSLQIQSPPSVDQVLEIKLNSLSNGEQFNEIGKIKTPRSYPAVATTTFDLCAVSGKCFS